MAMPRPPRKSGCALSAARFARLRSTTQSEPPDQRLVAGRVGSPEVIEQPTPLANHDQQTTPGMKVLLVAREMIGQVADPLRQDRDLHLGGPGVTGLGRVFRNERLLALGGNRHRDVPFFTGW